MNHRRTFPRKQSLVLGGVFLIVLIAAYPAAARPSAWSFTSENHIMLVSPGSQGHGGGSYSAISDEGRYVAFESHAADLAPGHVDDSRDVFLSDLDSSQTLRVSISSAGTPVYNPGDYTSSPAVAGGGRYVVFMSRASDLVPGDDNAMPDIFIRDRVTETTRLVSVAADGSSANGPSYTPVVSDDGRYVAFQSLANNLVANDTNDSLDVFVRDMQSGVTKRVSVTDTGEEGYSSYEYAVSTISISADGRFIAFSYEYLPAQEINLSYSFAGPLVFIHDQQTGTLEQVAVGTDPTLSSSGDYLVFLSGAPLTDDDTNNGVDVYLFNRQAKGLERVTLPEGAEPNGQEILGPADISDDGRFVVYAANGGLTEEGVPGEFHVYLRDRTARASAQVDAAMNGGQANGESRSPSISDDGKRVAFSSNASNLVPGDTNNDSDVFVYLNETGPSAIAQDTVIYLSLLLNQ